MTLLSKLRTKRKNKRSKVVRFLIITMFLVVFICASSSIWVARALNPNFELYTRYTPPHWGGHFYDLSATNQDGITVHYWYGHYGLHGGVQVYTWENTHFYADVRPHCLLFFGDTWPKINFGFYPHCLNKYHQIR